MLKTPLLLVFLASLALSKAGKFTACFRPWSSTKPGGVNSGSELIVGKNRPMPPLTTPDLFDTYPKYRQTAACLTSIPEREVGPRGLLYVGQREMAVTSPQDENVNVMGTAGLTTCVLAILRHTGSKATGVVHFDEQGVKGGVTRLVARVRELTPVPSRGRYELTLIAAYVSGERKQDNNIYMLIMDAFSQQEVDVYLVQAVVGWRNTVRNWGRKYPILQGAAINLNSGEIFPARFTDKGPEQPLRNARVLTGPEEVMDIYDSSQREMKIGPFTYATPETIDTLLQAKDKAFLKAVSTTPWVEGPDFVKEIRGGLRFMKRHPNPLASVFINKQPLRFKRNLDKSAWIRV